MFDVCAVKVIESIFGFPSLSYLNIWSPTNITYSAVPSAPFKLFFAVSSKLSHVSVPVINTFPASNLIVLSPTVN